MPPFRDDQIIIIAPGSHTTLAQLGLPESFTPARHRIRSRMFPGEKSDEWEPHKVCQTGGKLVSSEGATNGADTGKINDEEVTYEEDPDSDEGAVWPMVAGKITNWSCFFALMQHVYNALNAPFHTPILLLAQPKWTPREHERLTQFFFEKLKPPAFTIMDSAQATCYGFGLPTATVIDIGADKADVTAVTDFLVQEIGRGIAIPECGGEKMTQRLLDVLSSKGFTRDMCDQLKRSPICEVLPAGTPLPTSNKENQSAVKEDVSTAYANGDGSIPNHRYSATPAETANAPARPEIESIDEQRDEEETEGVVDVASIVAGGKMTEYLARKEREKAEKAAAKKKGADASAAQPKPIRLRNSDKEFNTFSYETTTRVKTMDGPILNGTKSGSASTATVEEISTLSTADQAAAGTKAISGSVRRDIIVGPERFLAATGGILDTLAAAIHRTILSVPDTSKRGELWESLIIVGNGSKIRGFFDALVATLNEKYLISPSSATIFTSELPSNLSTPLPTGANTPQHHGQSSLHSGHGVNPLLLAATTASAQTSGQHHLHPPMQSQYHSHHNTHTSHGQTPTSIKVAKIPEYFPEWKDVGSEEAGFLGAQVAAKVLFVVDQAAGKGYMTRTDYNEQGPSGIHDYSM